MRRTPLFLCALILICSGALLQAQDRCKANEKIHAAMKRAVDLNLDSFEVNLGNVDPKMRSTIHTKAADSPLVIFFQNGVNIVEKDFDIDTECWDLFFDYVVGTNVFLGAVAANFENTDEPIQVVFQLEGQKNKTIKKAKVIPSLRIIAYFVRLRLSSDPGPYGLTTRVLSRRVVPFLLLHELQTFFYVNDTQL